MAQDESEGAGPVKRRSVLRTFSSAIMASGLTLGYGMFATLLGVFLYPFRKQTEAWQFVAELGSFAVGESMTYESPAGQKVVVTRLAEKGAPDDFIALSSVCPHLGCQVHWELNNNRFFCPCHNGVFDREGNPLEGPVKDAQQTLPRYPLQVRNGLLFIQVPVTSLA